LQKSRKNSTLGQLPQSRNNQACERSDYVASRPTTYLGLLHKTSRQIVTRLIIAAQMAHEFDVILTHLSSLPERGVDAGDYPRESVKERPGDSKCQECTEIAYA
jgi:hypothetical protein